MYMCVSSIDLDGFRSMIASRADGRDRLLGMQIPGSLPWDQRFTKEGGFSEHEGLCLPKVQIACLQQD